MLRFAVIVLIIHLLVPGFSTVCDQAEYRVEQDCCPKCPAGQYVKKTCTDHTTTTCAPCNSSTYTDELNGRNGCLPCTVCEPSAGLRVKRGCSSTSDTLCEPLEGHYCTDLIKDDCRGAVNHTKCKPGQYINQTGTASSDTVCVVCPNDTYSNGSFTSCRPHTRCESLGRFTWKPGTHTADAVCRHHRHHKVLWVVLALFCFVLVLLALSRWHWWRRKSRTSQAVG